MVTQLVEDWGFVSWDRRRDGKRNRGALFERMKEMALVEEKSIWGKC